MTTPTTAEPQYTVSQGAEVAKEFTGTSNGATIRMGFEILKLRATIARLEGELEVERMCLAACAVAAWGGEVRDTLSPYDSDSLRAVVALRTRADAAERRVEALAAGLRAVEALIHESHGVVGLHLNGDIAVWEDLRTGGSFEEWLREFDTALAAASGDTTTTGGGQ